MKKGLLGSQIDWFGQGNSQGKSKKEVHFSFSIFFRLFPCVISLILPTFSQSLFRLVSRFSNFSRSFSPLFSDLFPAFFVEFYPNFFHFHDFLSTIVWPFPVLFSRFFPFVLSFLDYISDFYLDCFSRMLKLFFFVLKLNFNFLCQTRPIVCSRCRRHRRHIILLFCRDMLHNHLHDGRLHLCNIFSLRHVPQSLTSSRIKIAAKFVLHELKVISQTIGRVAATCPWDMLPATIF